MGGEPVKGSSAVESVVREYIPRLSRCPSPAVIVFQPVTAVLTSTNFFVVNQPPARIGDWSEWGSNVTI